MTIPKKEFDGLVSINGTKLYVETAGKGEALLFIHAGIGDSRMWNKQYDEFSKTHYVIRCDLRGFGQSKMSSGVFAHHKDIAAILEYLEVEKAIVLGASFGGHVAIDFALTQPELVKKLILVSPALGRYEFESPEMLQFFNKEEEKIKQGDWEAATELNLKMWVDGPQRSAEEVSQNVREQVREMQMNIFSQPEVDVVEEIELAPPAITRLGEIDIPTMVISGNLDVIEFQEISNLLADNIKNVKQIVMSGVAHLPSMEKPDEFNRIVRDFVK
ncbi:MAG: alpha/beta hydrolase [Anaerolineales bacterium]|nr:alpha/beta hydrolase [Anaerolineales bacterium]